MKKYQVKIDTPKGIFFSAEIEEENIVDTQRYIREACKQGACFDMNLFRPIGSKKVEIIYLPREMIQKTIFTILEV